MITSIQRLETSETVYNISVAEDHSYVTECCTLRNCGSNKKWKVPVGCGDQREPHQSRLRFWQAR